ncbi:MULTISPECIES: EamA family transporter RarD [Comamonas]|uniref:Permease n=1 Tax=Comamonas testosteroni TaxID=285 RepID=A0A096F0H2_COMTE|nr:MULTISPECIES: EamA family transporter RarD [Comamonas]KGH23288.1 permease [Comamonas testosteroni]MPT10796.1 EamA family transporter RarD [Comamonas sp.]
MFKGVVVSVLASVLFASLYYLSPFLAPLDGEQIFGWRVLVTLPFTTALLFALKEVAAVRALLVRALAQPRFGLLLVLSSALLGVQLWIFMWAPMNGRALPVSLGYFLLPLVMVVAGRVLFAERLTLGQGLATLVAAAGVAHEFWQAGGMSWETWVVALGYTVYFSLRRWLQTDTLAGHWIDMALLVPVAVGFTLREPGSWPLLAGNPSLWALLPLLGIVSAVALALYMIASRWLPLGLFGLLSYVEPVLLVVVAWLLGESMDPQQQLSYALIFAAVGLLVGDGFRHSWRGRSHTSD